MYLFYPRKLEQSLLSCHLTSMVTVFSSGFDIICIKMSTFGTICRPAEIIYTALIIYSYLISVITFNSFSSQPYQTSAIRVVIRQACSESHRYCCYSSQCDPAGLSVLPDTQANACLFWQKDNSRWFTLNTNSTLGSFAESESHELSH